MIGYWKGILVLASIAACTLHVSVAENRQLHIGEQDEKDSLMNHHDRVVALRLVDRLRQPSKDLGILYDGMTINLDHVDTYLFNVEAIMKDEDSVSDHEKQSSVGSVVFLMDGKRTDDNGAPFWLVQYDKGFEMSMGWHTIKAQAWTGTFGRGQQLSELQVHVFVETGSEMAKNIPKLMGHWEEMPSYPGELINPATSLIGETQGRIMGDDYVVVGGFNEEYSAVRDVWSLNLNVNSSAARFEQDTEWTKRADFPIEDSVTHAGYALQGGNLLYICGGYLGKYLGPVMDDCFLYNKTADMWTTLPNLPDARGGGGMVYIESMHALVFSLGASTSDAMITVDFNTTWMLELTPDMDSNMNSLEWQEKAPCPFAANHVSAITAYDCEGMPHYMFVGGQYGEGERYQNVKDHVEYLPHEDRWIRRKAQTMARGHTASSIVAYSCGYIRVGGSVNSNNGRNWNDADISYYDIPTDTWTRMGNFLQPATTPLCDIHPNVMVEEGQPPVDYLYCGLYYTKTLFRMQLKVTPPEPWINEIHDEDHNGVANGYRAIEIAYRTNVDISNYMLLVYDGPSGRARSAHAIPHGVLADRKGVVNLALVKDISLAPNRSGDAFALVDASGHLIEFLSCSVQQTNNTPIYASNGPAEGRPATNVCHEGVDGLNTSIQLVGEGNHRLDFTWAATSMAPTVGQVNTNQSFVVGEMQHSQSATPSMTKTPSGSTRNGSVAPTLFSRQPSMSPSLVPSMRLNRGKSSPTPSSSIVPTEDDASSPGVPAPTLAPSLVPTFGDFFAVPRRHSSTPTVASLESPSPSLFNNTNDTDTDINSDTTNSPPSKSRNVAAFLGKQSNDVWWTTLIIVLLLVLCCCYCCVCQGSLGKRE